MKSKGVRVIKGKSEKMDQSHISFLRVFEVPLESQKDDGSGSPQNEEIFEMSIAGEKRVGSTIHRRKANRRIDV